MAARGDHSEFIAFSRRIMRALSRRVSLADPEDLGEMLELAEELDACIVRAVAGLRESGFSWAQIGEATGTSRQAAHARWSSRMP
jgi:predicted DNA-binding protein (UPF0278 family)